MKVERKREREIESEGRECESASEPVHIYKLVSTFVERRTHKMQRNQVWDSVCLTSVPTGYNEALYLNQIQFGTYWKLRLINYFWAIHKSIVPLSYLSISRIRRNEMHIYKTEWVCVFIYRYVYLYIYRTVYICICKEEGSLMDMDEVYICTAIVHVSRTLDSLSFCTYTN